MKPIIVIPLKSNLQLEYAEELAVKLDDMLNVDYRACLEILPKGDPEPIGIGIFKAIYK